MSIVRVNENEAPHLIDAFASRGQLVTDTIADLSPLMAEALALLEQGEQNPLYGPIPAFTTVATDLRAESRDLAWRLDWIKQHDATNIPDSLTTALESKGLDTGQQQQVERWMLAGLTFTEAVDQANKERFDENWAMFRRQEADTWSTTPQEQSHDTHSEEMDAFRRQEAQATVERTPIDEARHSLEEIRVVLDSAKHDRDRHVGATVSDGIWSTEDLDAMIENEDGFYTATQVAHARTVLAMAQSSPEAREYLGITQSGDGWSLSDIGHLTLDVLGLVPIVGNAADGINATWYAAEGEYLDAALASMALIPVIGQSVTLAKPLVKTAANGRVFRTVREALEWATRWLEDAGILQRGANNVVEESDFIFRGDNFPFSPAGREPGRVTSHVDPISGDLIPANVDGTSGIHHHVRGAEPSKSDSPYSSFSDDPAVAPRYGDHTITIDRSRLETDIAAGRVDGVEVLSPQQVQDGLQSRIDRAQTRFDANPSTDNQRSLRRAELDLKNAARDNEYLVNGRVPSSYINVARNVE